MTEPNKDLSQAAEPAVDQSAELAAKDARIAELEGKLAAFENVAAELDALKVEAETLRAEKAAAELETKRKELLQFAEAHGLDLNAEAVKQAVEKADYAALMAESLKAKPQGKMQVASYAPGIQTEPYGGLLDAHQGI